MKIGWQGVLLGVFLSGWAFGSGQTDLAEQTEQFVVKVINLRANVFEPELQGGMGTGFIVELNKHKGVIFTNRHVIDSDILDAQKILVEFPVADGGRSEAISARIVYESPRLDFAVLEFDPAQLKRAKKYISVAPLAIENGQGPKRIAKGSEVMAFGHPLGSDNISTFGVISGVRKDGAHGALLQTSAAINPGNSGGPLVELGHGEVVGMNTAKLVGADNTGYAIPIQLVWSEYDRWRNNGGKARDRGFKARFRLAPIEALALEKADKIIEKAVPGMLDRAAGAIVVQDSDPASGLLVGDYLLKVDGVAVGDSGFMLYQALNQSDALTQKITVLRGKEVLTIDVPVVSERFSKLRQEVDFVYVSGLILKEYTPRTEWGISQGESRVYVEQVLQHSIAAETDLGKGALVTELVINGSVVSVKTLHDVKSALEGAKKNSTIRVGYHPPVELPVPDGGLIPLGDPVFGAAVVQRSKQLVVLPVDRVLTPRELSLRLMKEHFDFDGSRPEQRDWRFWIGKRPGCASLLKELADA